MSFQIHALPETEFAHLFDLSDVELARASAKRMIVDSGPGFPCRISLTDATIGETVILVNYQHQPHDTPYRATHAIFVRKGVKQMTPEPGQIPPSLKSRLLSIRAFDGAHLMIDADVAQGDQIEKMIVEMFENPAVNYLHLHYARPGCFAARVTCT